MNQLRKNNSIMYKGAVFLGLLALISLNIWLFSKITFIFAPVNIVLHTVMFPIVLGGICYFLFSPFVDWMERKRVKRWISILLLYVIIAELIVLLLSVVIPTLKDQITSLIQQIPSMWAGIQEYVTNWREPSWMTGVKNGAESSLNDLVPSILEKGNEWLITFGTSIFPAIGTLTGYIALLVATPLILFYLLKDGKQLPEYILQWIPVKVRESTRTIMKEINGQISSYIRGQILVSVCVGIMLFIGYLIIGLPYALTLAVVAAFTSVIPFLGPAIAITPAMVIALITDPMMALKLVVVWIIIQTLEGKIITPQVMGKSIKVHPITILFVILCAGKLFGVLGMIFAIPGYAVVKVCVVHVMKWIKEHTHLYKEPLQAEIKIESGEEDGRKENAS